MNTRQQISCESPSSSVWTPKVDGTLQVRALEVAREVAERVQNVLQHSLSSFHGQDFAGVLFPSVFFARAFPEQNWASIAHALLVQVAEETLHHPITVPCLFGGTAGLATAVAHLSLLNPQYRTLKKSLDEQLAEQVLNIRWRRDTQDVGVAAQEYDLIGGASGILGYLVSIPAPSSRVQLAVSVLLDYLIWLSGEEGAGKRRRWYIPPTFYPLASERERYPEGYYNCGLAHGIPGPLAALASAWIVGYQVSGQRDAMRSLSDWLLERQLYDRWGNTWTYFVPEEQEHARTWETLPPARNAWCYGSPGIACALRLTGTALHDQSLCDLALRTLKTVLQRPGEAQNIPSSTFCHGTSGLLSVCLRFAHEMHDQDILGALAPLVERLLAQYDPNSTFGFRDSPTTIPKDDTPSWLTGAPGVAMVLLSAATDVEPTWHSAVLLTSPRRSLSAPSLPQEEKGDEIAVASCV